MGLSLYMMQVRQREHDHFQYPKELFYRIFRPFLIVLVDVVSFREYSGMVSFVRNAGSTRS